MKNQARSEFIAVIDALIFTMQEVISTNATFDMRDWFIEDDRSKHLSGKGISDVTECGYAACICGYQAASQRFEAFKPFDLDPLDPEDYTFRDAHNMAADVADAIDTAAGELFHDSCIGESIYESSVSHRRECALEIFTKEEIRNLKHLHESEPTANDAVEYLIAFRKKLNEMFP